MSTGQATTYDELPYTDRCFAYTHPDYLATVGALFGIETAPAGRCRVLELGCAAGGNLLPMAMEFPESEFVGIDLSPRQVEAGRAAVEAIGLRNVDLRTLSITDVDDRLGRFDYIVCHGVYSWVPAAVRDKILAICSEQLAPGGIAYVSYNTYPGWHGRGLIREMLAFHVRGSTAALERVQRSRDFLGEIVAAVPDKASSYARILRTEAEYLRLVGDSYMYHEHLEETNHPFYFHEFMASARSRGLQFLAEAGSLGLVDNLPPESRAVVERWSDDAVAREQYLDFLNNRTFRRTLLCHEHCRVADTPSPEPIGSLWIGTTLQPVSENPRLAPDAAEEFRKVGGDDTVATNNPLVKAALVLLHEARPRSVAFADLWDGARSLLERETGTAPDPDTGPGDLRDAMLRCFLANLVELQVRPPRFATEPGERPVASPLARLQAAAGPEVTNLRRKTVRLDVFDRLVLRGLDGRHDRAAVVASLVDAVRSGEFAVHDGDRPIDDLGLVREIVGSGLEPTLRKLAGLALLVE